MAHARPRLGETPRVDAERAIVDSPAVPGDAAEAVTIRAEASRFVVTNRSAVALSVLVTFMAKATGTDAAHARARLVALTSSDARPDPLWLRSLESSIDPYASLWQDDIAEFPHARGGWVATRSGGVVLPLPAGVAFELGPEAEVGSLGAVVAGVAAVGADLDGPVTLTPVDHAAIAALDGPSASRGAVTPRDG